MGVMRRMLFRPVPLPVQGGGHGWEAGHDPRRCSDQACDRLACRGYRIGYQDGWAAGYAAGYSAGSASGR